MAPGNFINSPLSLIWVLSAALGIFFLWKLLSRFFKTPVVLLTAFLVLFGTNYFGMFLFAGPTANAFLFTLFLVMILLTDKWKKEMKWTPLFLMFPVMILVSFLSGTGIFIMLFQVFAWILFSFNSLRLSALAVKKTNCAQLLFLAGIFIACLLLRQIPWFTGPGAEFYYGDLLKAQFPIVPANIHRVLFSVKNGWLVYSPLVIFAMTGFYFLAEKNRKLFFASFLFMIISLVTAASNPTWWFADRFGYPNLVETYAILCLPLGYFIQWAWNKNLKIRFLLFFVAVLLVSLNLFQTWQFSRSVILPGKMTGRYYRAVFWETAPSDMDRMLLEPSGPWPVDSIPDEPWITCRSIAWHDFENRLDADEPFRLERAAHSGKQGILLNPRNRFSPKLSVPVSRLTDRDSCRIKADGDFFFTCKNAVNKVFLVITCIRQGVPYKYRITDLSASGFHPNRWNHVTMHYLVPFPADPDDLVQVYFMNFGDEECCLDDFEIKLCKPTLQE